MKEITRTDWSGLPVGYLSPTQVWSYISCPYCYFLERIERVPKPVSADLMIGRFAHASLADMRQQMVETLDPGQPFDTERSVDVGAAAFDSVITEQVDREDTGEETPIEIELTKKYARLDEAKDAAARLTRYALPMIAKYDREAGIAAFEARVRHLGPSFMAYPDLAIKLGEEELRDAQDEAHEQAVDGVVPVFPFPFKAFLDVAYANGVIKDAKTSSRQGAPDALATIQLLTYGMPWWAAGAPMRLGFDVMVKTKAPDFAVYWLDAKPEHYEYAKWRTLQAADDICSGRFPPSDGSLFCKYEHLGLRGERAAMDFPVAV